MIRSASDAGCVRSCRRDGCDRSRASATAPCSGRSCTPVAPGDSPDSWGGCSRSSPGVSWCITASGTACWRSWRCGNTAMATESMGMAAMNRWQFYGYLIAVVPLLYLFGVVTIAGAAAAAITSEHEEDTWVSLTATDLTGREILVAKLLGAMKRASRSVGRARAADRGGDRRGVAALTRLTDDRPFAGGLWLVRRGAGALDLAPAPLDLARPVPDDRRPVAGQHRGPRGRQYAGSARVRPAGLAGLHAL